MQLFSVNVGRTRAIQDAKQSGTTGICKIPVQRQGEITRQGLSGDAICDLENHGGPDQAIYVYGTPDYAWWSESLGRELPPGTFGENLTMTDLESARLQIGDRLQLGDVVLEVTAPRIPCVTLAARMGDPAFVKRFREAERPGVYCRVLEPGFVEADMPVSLVPFVGETISVIEMFRDFYDPDLSVARIRQYPAAPIAIRDRLEKEQRLAKRLAGVKSAVPPAA